MSNAILDFLKSALPGKPLVINPEEDTVGDEIRIVLAAEEDCENHAIAKYPVMLAPNLIDIEKNEYLIASKAIPRIRKMKPGDPVPRNYIPIASWDGKQVVLSLPMSANNGIIRDTLIAGLPLLVNTRGVSSSYTEMCKYIKFGFDNEKARLEKNIKSNKTTYERIVKDADQYLQKVIEQERILDNLVDLEKNAVEKHAKEHWEMMSELVPISLQELYIEDKYIIGITQPVSLLGVYLGSYKISIAIAGSSSTRNDIAITHLDKSLDRDNYCHPHIRSGGGVCWGNLSDKVRELITKKDYHGIMECSLKIIRHYNSDDPYLRLDHWGEVSANPEEAGSRVCRSSRNSPQSLMQVKKCLECQKNSCSYKENNSRKIYNACHSLSLPQDCVYCKESACHHKIDAYERCFASMKSLGTAFCMLRCKQENCPHMTAARELCEAKNKRINGTCPASDKCRMPCVTEGENK